MKKMVLILVCLLSSNVLANKPVIVRDKFTEAAYYVYIPADFYGDYWSRWLLSWPTAFDVNLFPVHEVVYGIVRPGKWQNYDDATGESGTFYNSEVNGWQAKLTKGLGNYLEFDIPDGHNRIHLLLYNNPTSYSDLTLSLSSGGDDVSSELDINSVDVSEYSLKALEFAVATSSTSTNRKFRITLAEDNKWTAIIGVHSFDDDAIGDPSTANGGLAVGHDIVDTLDFSGAYQGPISVGAVSGHSSKLMYGNTSELTINWKATEESSTKWTGYGGHYGTGDAHFTATSEPNLSVDGAVQGTMADTAQIALAELHEGDSIVTTVTGYGDYDKDDVEDSEDILKPTITQTFTESGVQIGITINWTGDGTALICYVPSIPIDDTVTGIVRFEGDTPETIGSGYRGKSGTKATFDSNSADCVFTGEVIFDGSMNEIGELAGDSKKTYFSIDTSSLTTPDNGVSWNFSTEMQILKSQEDWTSNRLMPNLGPEELIEANGADIDVGTYSVPSYVDWNNDGLNDLVIGTGSGYVHVYLNTGTQSNPQFSSYFRAQSDGADLYCTPSGCMGCFPRVVYWDADARKDLLVGLSDGTAKIFLNTGSDSDPNFDGGTLLQVGQPGSKTNIDVGNRATSTVVDWNNDGKKDLVIGAYDGLIHLFINSGTDTEPNFLAQTYAKENGSNLDVPSDRSSPAVLDLDDDAKKDILTGNTNGQLLFYSNVGTDADPCFSGYSFIKSEGVPIDLPGTPRSRPFVCDWTGDGYYDVLIGAYDGKVHLYQSLLFSGDFEPDGDVDFADFAVFASAWWSVKGDENWNPACDISDPNDDAIDILDMAVFSDNWLEGVE